ncbi:ABC transporter ATP-binding protein [Mycoplasma sp. P36-A1]|uniref:ABC transporter ATP-binding protein n=1 Tax=Mycoplasma sp. P36-A1 TaxID=3252900 RepID=UPI003C2CCC94
MNIIEANNLSINYGSKNIIKEQNISIQENKITVILGPNGCGKSTLLKSIARIIPINEGKIYLDSLDMKTQDSIEIAKKLGFLPQILNSLDGLSVEELVSYGRYPHQKTASKSENRKAVAQAMRLTKTNELASTNINSLSGGQKQRVWIAMVLAAQTKVVLLDEPTTYLDIGYQIEVLELLKSLNNNNKQTIVMVLHDINHAARYADWIITLKDGKVFKEGTPKDIITVENIKHLYNVDSQIIIDSKHDCPVCISFDL